MRSIRLLNLQRLREQPVRALLAVIAIAAGTTLLVAVLIDQSSVNASMSKFVTQRAGPAKLEVHGPGGPAGLDERVLPKVAAVKGVKAAVPLVQVITVAETAHGDERYIPAFGVDCSVQAIVGDFGCKDQQLTGVPGAYAVSTRLAHSLGEGGVVRTDEGRLPIENGFPIAQLNTMNNGNIAVFPLTDAQRLFGHQGALTSILVVPERGASVVALRHDIAAVIGRQNLVDPPGTIGNADDFAKTIDAGPKRSKIDSVWRTHESGDSEILQSMRNTRVPNRRPAKYHNVSAITAASAPTSSSLVSAKSPSVR